MPFSHQSQPQHAEGILFGPQGLRAGWSLLLYLVLFTLVLVLGQGLLPASLLGSQRNAAGEMRLGNSIAGEAISLLAAMLPALLLARLESRSLTAYGLGGRRRLRPLLLGALAGAVLMAGLIGTLASLGALRLDASAWRPAAAVVPAAEWAAVFLLVALYEEFFFRGFLQSTLTRGLAALATLTDVSPDRARTFGFWASAVLLSGGFFAATHVANGNETSVGLLAVAAAGLLFAYSLFRSGSLWWAIGFHAAWDYAQSFVFGAADSGVRVAGHLLSTVPAGPARLSGGVAGPEGSLLVFPALLLAALAARLSLPRQPPPAV